MLSFAITPLDDRIPSIERRSRLWPQPVFEVSWLAFKIKTSITLYKMGHFEKYTHTAYMWDNRFIPEYVMSNIQPV